MRTVDYHGIECVELTNESLSLLATVSVGPRLIELKGRRGESPFAFVPDLTLDCPGEGQFHFVGGHRLWVGPEDRVVTYAPDDAPVACELVESGLRLTQAIEARTSLQKVIQIRLIDQGSVAEVRHTITNRGEWARTLAPWAITQLKPGGIALLPQPGNAADGDPALPNRSIALWPYTDLQSEHIRWGNELILVRARMTHGKLKLGIPNPAGWLAYWWDGLLFVKRAKFDSEGDYLDRGSSSECYCDGHFLELETLGPVTTLEPGGSVEHVETWSLHEGIAWSDGPEAALAAIARG